MRLDPSSAAQYAVVAVALVLIGALLTSTAPAEQRGAVLAGVVSVLLAIAWRGRHGAD